MPLLEFWNHVRTAAMLAPFSRIESRQRDQIEWELILRGSTTWQSPRAVQGFDIADFWFLPQGQRERLAGSVDDFRQSLQAEPGNDDLDESALGHFLDIIRILQFDRHNDAEAFRLGTLFEERLGQRRPQQLVELRYSTGLDHTGDPGFWIWAFLSDESDEDFLARASTLNPLLTEIAREIAPDRFPYLNFRSVADQEELVRQLEAGEE